MARDWTETDDAYIRAKWGADGVSQERMCRMLSCTRKQLRYRAIRLGLTGHPRRPWSAKEDDLVREQFGRWSTARLGRELNRTPGAVEARAKALALRAAGWRVELCADTVSQILGRDRATIVRWLERGELRGRKDASGRWRVWPKTLRALVVGDPSRINLRGLGDAWEVVALVAGEWGGEVQ